MSTPSHVRVASLVLALSAVVGGWLFLEYSQRTPPHQPSQEQLVEDKQTTVAPPGPVPRAQPKATNSVSQSPSKNLVRTFKCEQGGRVSYSDQPCASGARTLAATTAEDPAPVTPTNNLQKLKAQAAAMEADRLARERQYEIAAAATAKAPSPVADQKARECADIDQGIAFADAQLLQLHSASRGDYWTAERRKLTDRRFSLGC